MLKLVKFSASVSRDEETKLYRRPKIQLFLKTIDQILIDFKNDPNLYFRDTWLISSIDHHLDGSLRTINEHGGYEKTTHVNSQAVDFVPLTKDGSMQFPTPLNYLTRLHDIFIAYFSNYNKNDLPVIGFEADHIHVDVVGPGGIYRKLELKPYFDKNWFASFQLFPYRKDIKRLVSFKVIRLL